MVQLKHYRMLDFSVVPQISASVKPEYFIFPFFITHIKICCVSYMFLSVEMYKGSAAAEENKAEYEHV